MAWYIVSVPFWLLSALFLLGAFVAIPMKKPYETSEQLAMQVVLGFIVSGIFGCIAAWLVS